MLERYPKCCGSEDGEVLVGVDSTPDADAMVTVWKCNSCGLYTILSSVLLEHNE